MHTEHRKAITTTFSLASLMISSKMEINKHLQKCVRKEQWLPGYSCNQYMHIYAHIYAYICIVCSAHIFSCWQNEDTEERFCQTWKNISIGLECAGLPSYYSCCRWIHKNGRGPKQPQMRRNMYYAWLTSTFTGEVTSWSYYIDMYFQYHLLPSHHMKGALYVCYLDYDYF